MLRRKHACVNINLNSILNEKTNQNQSMIENQLKIKIELSRGIFGFDLFIVEILSRLMRQMNLNTNNVIINDLSMRCWWQQRRHQS